MLHPIDYVILVVPVAVLLVVAWRTRRYVKGVSDFMSGGRVAGRYLVAVSDGMAVTGLITILALFEFAYTTGLSVRFWQAISIPVGMVLSLTGFVIYRFRETRAMTLAQFFEARYSRRFRIFAGILGATSGIINYGIFPAVSSKFFVYYCGLPEVLLIGGWHLPTHVPLMAIFLTVACTMTLSGGQLTIMVTDFLEGMFTHVTCITLSIAVLCMFSWTQLTSVLSATPAGYSKLNPFDSFALKDFNLGFVLISAAMSIYGVMAWQGPQGFNSAAANAHEAKMGKMLGTWRSVSTSLMVVVLALAAYTFMNHPDFAAQSKAVAGQIEQIANPAIRDQQRVPIVLSHILPIGLAGAFMAVMAFLMVSTDATYLHSWGSMIIQDIVLPIRNRPFTPEQQLRLLRFSVAGVAVFVFIFSLVFKQTSYILMFMALTGAIYMGGAGACIIGGLYWRRGTAAGAWGAMIVGSGIAVASFILTQTWPTVVNLLLQWFPDSSYLAEHKARFPINGQVTMFLSAVGGCATYIALSLLTSRAPFDLETLLHRDGSTPAPRAAVRSVPEALQRLIGISPQFTRADRILAFAVFGWSMLLFLSWLGATLWNLVFPWKLEIWGRYFLFISIIFPMAAGVISTVVFGIGGTIDLREMFRRLREMPRDVKDDGRVEHPPESAATASATAPKDSSVSNPGIIVAASPVD